jgi:hypothetical protein
VRKLWAEKIIKAKTFKLQKLEGAALCSRAKHNIRKGELIHYFTDNSYLASLQGYYFLLPVHSPLS